jgi:hypothetical protein
MASPIGRVAGSGLRLCRERKLRLTVFVKALLQWGSDNQQPVL